MIDPAGMYDLVLALTLVGLAVRILTTRDLFKGVALFIVFGLLLALSWARLGAPDIALAEAAIGAGLTGALLIEAASGMRTRITPNGESFGRAPCSGGLVNPPDALIERSLTERLSALWLALPLGLSLIAMLTAAVLALPAGSDTPRPPVAEMIEASGVTHPVTAVLLNFRGYDTWLEVGVLILAVLAILALHRVAGLTEEPAEATPDPVLVGAAWALIPFMVLAGGYLLWRGTHGPGGAFQAGAVLGAAGILLRLTGERRLTSALLGGRALRVLAIGGFAAFLLTAVGTLFSAQTLLAIPPGWAAWLIVAIEAAVTISIAWTLSFFYVGATPYAPRGPRT